MNLIKTLINKRQPQLLISSTLRSMFSSGPQAAGESRKIESTRSKETESKLVQVVNRERSLNVVTLIGRIGRDPSIIEKEKPIYIKKEGEVKELNKFSVFTMATSEYAGLDASGEAKFRVDWHRIVVVAEHIQRVVQKYLRKGDRVHVIGRLHYNISRDKDGEPKLVTTVVADDLIFLSKNIDSEI